MQGWVSVAVAVDGGAREERWSCCVLLGGSVREGEVGVGVSENRFSE